MTTQALTGERADLLQSLARSRHFLRHTTHGLTDEQATQRTTASELASSRPEDLHYHPIADRRRAD